MSTPKYVERIIRVTRAFAILADYPAGMRLAGLAERLDTTEEELRQDFRVYYSTDPPLSLVGRWSPLIAFVSHPSADPAEDEPDIATAGYVRLMDTRSGENVGVEFLSVGELSVASRAGHDLLAREPENTVLEQALETLDHSVLAGFDRGGPSWLGDRAHELREAVRERRRVWIVYARAWLPGVVERIVEPYQVIHTRRGWELDAAVPERDGDVRSFLVSGIREMKVLDETFERPADAEERAAANRALKPVELIVPHGARWAVEKYAESVEVVTEDEERARLRAYLLEPVEERLGLLLIAAGSEATLVGPEELADARRKLAQALLEHHRS